MCDARDCGDQDPTSLRYEGQAGRPPDVRVQTGQTVIYFSTRLAYGFPINSPATTNSADALLQTIGIFTS